MKWLKRLLLLLVTLLLSGVLIMVGAVVLLGEDHYKRLLSWGAEQFLDSQLVINGPINFDISRNLLIDTGDILLKANDDSFSLSIGEFQGSFRLGSYIRTGTFWLNSLILDDVIIEVMQTEDAESFDFEDLTISPVIIGEATISNLVFAYQELHPGTLHTFSLNELTIAELGEYQPVSLRATGLFEGQPFELQGKSDSIAMLLEKNEPNNISLELNSSLINASVVGTIDDPLNGHGLNLEVQTEIPKINYLLEVFLDDVPPLGSLHASINVLGEYEAPQLKNIDLKLHRDEYVNLNITGSIEDALTAEGIRLEVDGKTNNSELLSWLLLNEYDQMQAIQFSGTLHKDPEKILFDNVAVSAKTTDELTLTLNGSAEVFPKAHRITRQDANLKVQFNAPTVAVANVINLEGIPELGAVSGSLSLALGMDAIGIYNCDINLGSREQNNLVFKGDVGYVQFKDKLNLPELEMQTDIYTKNLQHLHDLLDLPGAFIPFIGPVTLQGLLKSHGSELQLHDAILDAGTKESAYMHATGGMAIQLHEPSRYNITFYIETHAQELAQLGEVFYVGLPEFGKTRITGWYEQNESKIEFKDARIEIGDTNNPTLRANARVEVDLQQGSDIAIDFDVGIADLVTVYSNLSPRHLGRMQGDAVISDIDGSWGIESFSFSSTQTDLFQWSAHGTYDDLVNYDEANVVSNLVIDSPPRLGEALGFDLAGVASFRKDGELNLTKKTLRYQGNMSIGGTRTTTQLSGFYKDEKPVLEGSFEIPILYLTDLGFGTAREYSTIAPTDEKSSSPHIFSREELDVSLLNKFDLDFDISIDEVRSSELTMDSINGTLTVHDGHFQLKPLQFVFKGGDADIALDIKAVEIPKYELEVDTDDLELGPLISQIQEDVPVRGYSNIDFYLATHGRSPHEMASNLNGDVLLGFENIRIPQKYVSLLSVDTFGWALSSAGIGAHTNLNCVVMRFDINDGLVTSNVIVADGPRMSLGGKIDMDLSEETLDIVLIPSQKKRVFSSATPVKIHGSMKDPEITAIPARAAATQVAGFTLLSGVFIPVTVLGKAWSVLSDGDEVGGGCENVQRLQEKAIEKNPDATDSS